MRLVLSTLVFCLVLGCGDDGFMAVGSGVIPPTGSTTGPDMGSDDAGADAGLDAALPFGCTVLGAGSGPNVTGDEPFTAQTASAFFESVDDCETAPTLSVLVFDDPRCDPSAPTVQIRVPVEDPTLRIGDNPVGFGTSGIQVFYLDAAGTAFALTVDSFGSVALSGIPTRTTPAGELFTYTPDLTLGVTSAGSDSVAVQLSGSVTVPLGAPFTCPP